MRKLILLLIIIAMGLITVQAENTFTYKKSDDTTVEISKTSTELVVRTMHIVQLEEEIKVILDQQAYRTARYDEYMTKMNKLIAEKQAHIVEAKKLGVVEIKNEGVMGGI